MESAPFILGLGILCSVFDLAYIALLVGNPAGRDGGGGGTDGGDAAVDRGPVGGTALRSPAAP